MGQALKFFDETDWILAACPFGAYSFSGFIVLLFTSRLLGVMHDLQGVNTLNLLQKSSGGPTDLGFMVINNSY